MATLARRHDRRHPLAEAVVRQADHQRVEHVGVSLQGRLDLLGEDLLAPGVDAHRSAAEQGDGPVGFDGRHVAEERPALAVDVDERLGRLGRVLVVLEGDVATAGETADDAGSGRHDAQVVVEHRVDVAHGEAGLGVVRLDLDAALVAGLRRAEAVHDEHVGQQGLELALHRGRERRAAGTDHEQLRGVVGVG